MTTVGDELVGEDRAAITTIVRDFFSAFTTSSESERRFEELAELFLPEALIVSTCGRGATTYDVDGFIKPRAELLTSGRLVEFCEWALEGRIDVFGDIAHWFGGYGKAGLDDKGNDVGGRGMKSMQFVRTEQGWKISAAAWDDERDGVAWPDGQAGSALRNDRR
jgi:hypothetical protein